MRALSDPSHRLRHYCRSEERFRFVPLTFVLRVLCTMYAILKITRLRVISCDAELQEGSTSIPPLPGAPSSSWAMWKARIRASFEGADLRVCTAFWLFGTLLSLNHHLHILIFGRTDQQRPLRYHPLGCPRPRRSRRTQRRCPPRRRGSILPRQVMRPILHQPNPILLAHHPLLCTLSMRDASRSFHTQLHRRRPHRHKDGRRSPSEPKQRRRRTELPRLNTLLRTFQPCCLG